MFAARCVLLMVSYLTVSTQTTEYSENVVTVSLYYESLCPYCRQFVKEELYPGYLKIKQALNIDLIPYGKTDRTKTNNTWNFNCQHGPKECFGNKIQACVLAQEVQQEEKIGFIGCMMGSSNPASVKNGENCASENNVLWVHIDDCIRSGGGDRLLAHYGERTDRLVPKLEYVPHILFNGVFNTTLENEARGDFLRTVCALFNVKPKGCNF